MMSGSDERLAEEVRKYRNLYDYSHRDYKDSKMAAHSWQEIGRTLCLEEQFCRSKWKNLRDRYVKAKRKVKPRSGDPGRENEKPIFQCLSWLSEFVKHREGEPKFPHSQESQGEHDGLMVSVSGHHLSKSPVMCSEEQPMSSTHVTSPLPGQPMLSDEVKQVFLTASGQQSETTSISSTSAFIPVPSFTSITPQETSSPLHDTGQAGQQKRKLDAPDDLMVKRLEELAGEKGTLNTQPDEDSRFFFAIADLAKRLPPHQRNLAKLKVHQMIFEMVEEYEDSRFFFAMADLAKKLPPRRRNLAKLKMHQMLFEMVEEYEDGQERVATPKPET